MLFSYHIAFRPAGRSRGATSYLVGTKDKPGNLKSFYGVYLLFHISYYHFLLWHILLYTGKKFHNPELFSGNRTKNI